MKLRVFLMFCLLATPFAAAAAPAAGSLIKLTCPAFAGVNDPCRAVYFWGRDGKRHAFPNSKVYFTWYADFSGVQSVTSATLASISLGQNVTSRPGVRMVKFQTDPKTYAVAVGGTLRWIKDEAAAIALYGANWNTKIDDVSDAFVTDYRFGTDIDSVLDYDPAEETAAAATIDDDLPSTRRSLSVVTSAGTFSIELIKLQKARYRMITDVAAGQDCSDQCTAKSLADYAQGASAEIGIHGSYFCPPDYADCAGKINTFLSPFFDSDGRVMVNEGSLAVHKGPMLTLSADGVYRYFHRTKDFGNSVSQFESSHQTALEAAASNYPSLIENGAIIVQGEERLEPDMKIIKGVRGGIGIDEWFAYLVVARSATVPDLAEIMKTLGATHAMNLDGGGSAALWYSGAYAFGPGRLLPNAILFKKR